MTLPKSLLTGSKIYVQSESLQAAAECKQKLNRINPSHPLLVTCDADDQNTNIEISWLLNESRCWDSEGSERSNATVLSKKLNVPCKHDGHIILDELKVSDSVPALPEKSTGGIKQVSETPVFVITKDGIYIFQLTITQPEMKRFRASIHIEIKATYGYLSAIDWPLLLVRKSTKAHCD